MSRTRLVLDRPTAVALAAGLVMLQVLIFSAGFLLGAARGVQALTPPDPPRPLHPSAPVRLASLTLPPPQPVNVGARLAPAREGVNPSPTSRKARAPRAEVRPSPLAQVSFSFPAPKVKPRTSPARTPRLPRTAEAYAAMFREAAEKHSVSPALVEAVAKVESGFNPRALSHKGARGLMQVIPATGRRFGVRSADKLFDPEHNIAAGVAYLAWLSKRYGGKLDFVIAAYNAGEGAVDDHGGIPPYRETRDYVRKVKAALRSIEERPQQEEAVPTPVGTEEERVGESGR